jgi:hypothetical protein
MSAFGDLFRHFPAKVAEMCLDECFIERRPVYYFDECSGSLAEQVPRCAVCGRVAFFHWRDDRWIDTCEPPIPSLTQDWCDNPQCAALYEWFCLKGYEGNKRRRAFKEKFGVYWVYGEGSDEKAARLALVMLEFTIRERNGTENRSRVA